MRKYWRTYSVLRKDFEALGTSCTVRPHRKKVGKAIGAALGPSARAAKIVDGEESEVDVDVKEGWSAT